MKRRIFHLLLAHYLTIGYASHGDRDENEGRGNEVATPFILVSPLLGRQAA
jgi:hypothetical protein